MDSNEIESAQQELISEFNLFDDWMGRYEYLIDLGKQLEAFPEQWRNEGRLHFCGTSDAAIVRGLIAVLFRVFNDRYPDEVLASTPDFISEIGFAQHLSPTRSNGLHAMLESVYAQARAHSASHQH